jgi:pyruvate dehydrogenase E2 component (dihydrolipoamide acetyltransferase)
MPHEIVIPRLGWSMEEGTFVGWLKKDGDPIQRGDALFELEGEKACQEIEAVDEGILRIPPDGPRPGSLLKVGAVVGYLVEPGATPPAAPSAEATGAPQKPSLESAPAAPSVRRLARSAGVALHELTGSGPGGRVLSPDIERAAAARLQTSSPRTVSADSRTTTSAFASPRARRVAGELGLDWRNVQGTGAGGRIRERDVRAAAQSNSTQSAFAGGAGSLAGDRIPVTSRRRLIAQRMAASRSQTVPVTLTTRADATNLVNLREQFKSLGESAVVPSFQDIVTKLVADALSRHRILAGRWTDEAILVSGDSELHLGMAVDTEQGLLVPVIRDVRSLTLAEVSLESRRLAVRARSGELSAAEMQGSCFTITNLGAFGIDAFTPVINLPETAILGLGAIRKEPVVLDDGSLAARNQISLSLTFDHRVLDGAPAARFLQELVRLIANPSASLLSR